MLKMARILRDYDEAGSVNSLLALWGFVDDHTFLTKLGHVGLVYRVGGLTPVPRSAAHAAMSPPMAPAPITCRWRPGCTPRVA